MSNFVSHLVGEMFSFLNYSSPSDEVDRFKIDVTLFVDTFSLVYLYQLRVVHYQILQYFIINNQGS